MKKLTLSLLFSLVLLLTACQSRPIDIPSVMPTVTSIPTNWHTFTKPNVFTIQYPADFELNQDTGLGGSFVGPSIVKVSFPKSAFTNPQSNFNGAYVLISASQDSEDKVTCTEFTDIPNMNTPLENVEINGVVFATAHISDAAAGNRYDSTLYRTLYKTSSGKSKCFELAATIHTGNIQNYDPPVAEFDKSTALTILQQIISSFKFIQ